MIPMIKCVKHGLCRADVIHVCKECEDKKKNQSNEQVLNQFKIEIALDMFNEWWCGYRGMSHDVADYEEWLKNRLEKNQAEDEDKKPATCLDKDCSRGVTCHVCINRNIIAKEGYNLIQIIERVPASAEQTAAVNAAEQFIKIAENTLQKTPESVIPSNNIEERLKILESKIEGVPGIVLSRSLDSQGSRWTLRIGPMSMPKRFFIGGTVEECLTSAEEFFNLKNIEFSELIKITDGKKMSKR
jgi:hypothetical protein